MATLWHRADRQQRLIFRVIRGAVLNYYDSHSIPRDDKLERSARSIAKRATGTLTSLSVDAGQWNTGKPAPERAEQPSGSCFELTRSANGQAVVLTCEGNDSPRQARSYAGQAGAPPVRRDHGRVASLIEKAMGSLSVRMWKLKAEPDKYERGKEALRLLARAKELSETL